MALETVSNLFGRTVNGFNRDLTSGGSSGGEGALVGLHGSPMGFGTDVGGSIRVPCAFNGIYGIRPTSKRISYDGMLTTRRGARGIAATVGPMCHSIRDMNLICKVVSDAELWREDPATIKKDWVPPSSLPQRLTIGVMRFDGVVMPHPPVLRAIDEAVEKLKATGHEIVEFKPYDHQRAWDIAVSIRSIDLCIVPV
jgi:amidase